MISMGASCDMTGSVMTSTRFIPHSERSIPISCVIPGPKRIVEVAISNARSISKEASMSAPLHNKARFGSGNRIKVTGVAVRDLSKPPVARQKERISWPDKSRYHGQAVYSRPKTG